MVALGSVRRVCDLCACLTHARERFCGLFAFLWCNCDHAGIAFEGGLIAGGAGEGPLLRDVWFAESFVCAVHKRRGVVLGSQLLRTSDALRRLLLTGLLLCAGGGRVSG